jgi:hypothetical protein
LDGFVPPDGRIVISDLEISKRKTENKRIDYFWGANVPELCLELHIFLFPANWLSAHRYYCFVANDSLYDFQFSQNK